jgi:serine/threonine protein kinase
LSLPSPLPPTPLASRPRHEPVLKIASGGMATVFLGSLQGELGFRQLVAIKRPHPHLTDDVGFRDAWLREARLAAGIHHANVVDVRDIEVVGDAIQLVMDYIEGASLGELVSARARAGGKVPAGVAVRVALDACAGLHAAHEACDEDGHPLDLVHRDVSPQNILVGLDGVARVTDFGIAKCAGSAEQATSQGMLKGKAGYMAPEYVRGEPVDRRADVFALGVVLWEALAGKRLFRGDNDSDTLARVLLANAPAISEADPSLAPLDAIVARALARERDGRVATAEELARDLEQAASSAGLVATHADVGRFVREQVGENLAERRRALRDAPRSVPPPAPTETTTAPEGVKPSTRRRGGMIVGAGVVVAVAVAGAIVLGRSHAPAAPSLAASSSPATAPASASAPAPATETAPSASTAAIDVPAPASTSSAASPKKRPTWKPGHAPPPTPYPSHP